jgi:hypothetical protein
VAAGELNELVEQSPLLFFHCLLIIDNGACIPVLLPVFLSYLTPTGTPSFARPLFVIWVTFQFEAWSLFDNIFRGAMRVLDINLPIL